MVALKLQENHGENAEDAEKLWIFVAGWSRETLVDFTEMAKLVVRSGGIVELVIGFWKTNYWEAQSDILSCRFIILISTTC